MELFFPYCSLLYLLSLLVYHVTEEGWTYHGNHDVGPLFYEYQDEMAKSRQ